MKIGKTDVPTMSFFAKYYIGKTKDFRAFGVADIRSMTAATAAVTLACLFTDEWLCYVLERIHSSYVLSTRIRLQRTY